MTHLRISITQDECRNPAPRGQAQCGAEQPSTNRKDSTMRYDTAIPLHGDPDDWTEQDVETDDERLVREQVERGLQLDQLVEDYREIADVLQWSAMIAQDVRRRDRLDDLLGLVNGHARAAESLAAQQNVLRVA